MPRLLVRCGTLGRAAPEMFTGDGSYCDPVGWYSLGVVAYCLLCGDLPWDSNLLDGEAGSGTLDLVND